MTAKMPVYFHLDQLNHRPLFEWAFGDKINHPETTHRAENILAAVEEHRESFELRHPDALPISVIKSVHNRKMVQAIQASTALGAEETFYPSVFPYDRNRTNLDPTNIRHAGSFCFDSGTPLTATTFGAAAWSAGCAIEATKAVQSGNEKYAYALCRPPGHHASKDMFGGYCYFNNAAIAANILRKNGAKVCILDIDFHHGNGTQSLFYRDPNVLVVNIHGDPNEFYPYFTGYESERGSGAGEGFNVNIPLPKGVDGQEFIKQLQERGLKEVRAFAPDILVLSAGFDTYVADPIGAFCLATEDFGYVGEAIHALNLPTVVIQEGGYEETSLGRNVTTLLERFLGR